MTPGLIGIGVGEEPGKIIQSISRSRCASRTVCYCSPGTFSGSEGVIWKEDPSPEEALVQDLFLGKLAAAVRGTLPSNSTLAALKRIAGVDHLERAALLETASGMQFLLAPVGVDEGWTIEEKVSLVIHARTLAGRLGLPGDVAILSGGRFGDVGRHWRVDKSLADAEAVAGITGARHFQILIEDAIESSSVILAPDGISGNLIFRTLVFLGSGEGHGAPVMNIERIFVDTSRVTPNYANALNLADTLSEQ